MTEAGEGEDGRMKSAIGIGSLLADGLGDTVRVSLTEDPEFELVPCQKLIDIGASLLETPSLYEKIPAWTETYRDFTNFQKRRGNLPAQLDGDEVDVRGYMHRDGSVFSVVSLSDLAKAEETYRSLGAKLVVGLPFKDIATSDSIYLPEVPLISDSTTRRAIKRLQEVSVGVLAPYEKLVANPLPNSIAVISLDTLATSGLPMLPEGAIRFALKFTGY